MAATFPLASVARRELAPVFASLRLVPPAKVSVLPLPVKESSVSLRRKESESIPSRVPASPPLPALIQLPFTSA